MTEYTTSRLKQQDIMTIRQCKEEQKRCFLKTCCAEGVFCLTPRVLLSETVPFLI